MIQNPVDLQNTHLAMTTDDRPPSQGAISAFFVSGTVGFLPDSKDKALSHLEQGITGHPVLFLQIFEAPMADAEEYAWFFPVCASPEGSILQR